MPEDVRAKRPNESVIEGARRVATDQLYTVRDRGGDMHAAASAAADAAVRLVLTDLHAMLYPEEHPGYDPDHIYWQGQHESEPAFQWSSEVTEWVGAWVTRNLGDVNDEE